MTSSIFIESNKWEVFFMDYVLQATANYGFPMVLSLYLLLRFEGKMDLLATSIQELIQAIHHQNRQ